MKVIGHRKDQTCPACGRRKYCLDCLICTVCHYTPLDAQEAPGPEPRTMQQSKNKCMVCGGDMLVGDEEAAGVCGKCYYGEA